MKAIAAASIGRGISRGVIGVVAFVPIDAELAETFLLESGVFQPQPLALLRCPHSVCPPLRPSQIGIARRCPARLKQPDLLQPRRFLSSRHRDSGDELQGSALARLRPVPSRDGTVPAT